MSALSEERERSEASIERAVQRTTDIVQQGMTDLKKVYTHVLYIILTLRLT